MRARGDAAFLIAGLYLNKVCSYNALGKGCGLAQLYLNRLVWCCHHTVAQVMTSRTRNSIPAILGHLVCRVRGHASWICTARVGHFGLGDVLNGSFSVNQGFLGLTPVFFPESDEAWANYGVVLEVGRQNCFSDGAKKARRRICDQFQ
jgi:hypothetical protein